MNSRKPIQTDRLTIRRFYPEDGQDLFEYLSNQQVYLYEPGVPVDLKQAKENASDMSNNEDFWAVELKSEKKVIGQLYFSHQEPTRLLTWELGYIISPDYQQCGYGSEAAKALAEFGFREWRIHRIQAHCNPDNVASWKLLENIGFSREGLLRKNIYFRKDESGNPLWMDSFVYARLEK